MEIDKTLLADLQAQYGVKALTATPVSGGYMNEKWRVSTDAGELFVKKFHPARFNRKQLERMEESLQRQAAIERSGVPTPHLWRHDGQLIRFAAEDLAYMVMDFRPGRTLLAESVSSSHMRSLGECAGLLHTALAALPAPADKRIPHFGGCAPTAPRALLAVLPNADAAAAAFELDDSFFTRFPQNWAHEDFHNDNILFDGDALSAIVDFDRCAWSYPAHDVARAVLSFALEDDGLNAAKIRAFREGYEKHLPMPHLADALKLTFCIEAAWWLRPEFMRADCTPVPKRFVAEMQWLAAHWACLGKC